MCSMLLMKLMEDFIPHVKVHSVVSVVFETNYLTNFTKFVYIKKTLFTNIAENNKNSNEVTIVKTSVKLHMPHVKAHSVVSVVFETNFLSFCHLGVTLASNLSWKPHIFNVYERACKRADKVKKNSNLVETLSRGSINLSFAL